MSYLVTFFAVATVIVAVGVVVGLPCWLINDVMDSLHPWYVNLLEYLVAFVWFSAGVAGLIWLCHGR